MYKMDDGPKHPIIYVRGYAMTANERDETAADPFCGLNVGSTVYRAVADRNKPAQKFYFESTVVRLMTDFGYEHVYENGNDLIDSSSSEPISRQSIIVFRYYDEAAPLVGGNREPSIERFARELSDLILQVRRKVCAGESHTEEANFRCYLVAHSMGGLICRAFLQNAKLGDIAARKSVDKVFTYATPHNGIEMAGVNVPRWLSVFDMNTFNRKTLAGLFGLEEAFDKTGRVDWIAIDDTLPVDRYFCMIGSNRADYEVAAGLSRTFSGHGGDGLVKIANASVCSLDKIQNRVAGGAAEAYAYRSHSGYFGIVNSEEAYQNLTRFLFGDVRIDIWLQIDSVSLPPSIANEHVEALYQFEVLVSPRGKPWFLTRRIAEEDSVACRTHSEIHDPETQDRRRVYLSSAFLAKWAKVDLSNGSLAYSLMLGVRVPDYEVGGRLWFKEHYEGAYLYRDTLIVELRPNGDLWDVYYGWQSQSPSKAGKFMRSIRLQEGATLTVDLVDSEQPPDVDGKLVFKIASWNGWQVS
jgi:hypothetical protein